MDFTFTNMDYFPMCSVLTAEEQLRHFLHQGPTLFQSAMLPSRPHPPFLIRLHLPLPNYNEPVACVRLHERFLITGTDILRCLLFRFRAQGYVIKHMKKFEEGVFSDLRALKHGDGSILEEAKSEFITTLYRFGCARTQKRQKVFEWHAVNHDKLFADALEREQRRYIMQNREGIHVMSNGFRCQLGTEEHTTCETARLSTSYAPLLMTCVLSREDPTEYPLNANVFAEAQGGFEAAAQPLLSFSTRRVDISDSDNEDDESDASSGSEHSHIDKTIASKWIRVPSKSVNILQGVSDQADFLPNLSHPPTALEDSDTLIDDFYAMSSHLGEDFDAMNSICHVLSNVEPAYQSGHRSTLSGALFVPRNQS